MSSRASTPATTQSSLLSPEETSGFLDQAGVRSGFPWHVPPSSPAARCLCCAPMGLGWFGEHQVHQFLAGMDMAKAVGKLCLLLPNSSQGFGVLQLHTLQHGTQRFSFFFAKIFSQTHWWGCPWEVGQHSPHQKQSKTKPNKLVIQVASEKICVIFVEYDSCMVTCVRAHNIACSVLSLCCVVSYSVFFNWRISVKYSGKRTKSAGTCWVWLS